MSDFDVVNMKAEDYMTMAKEVNASLEYGLRNKREVWQVWYASHETEDKSLQEMAASVQGRRLGDFSEAAEAPKATNLQFASFNEESILVVDLKNSEKKAPGVVPFEWESEPGMPKYLLNLGEEKLQVASFVTSTWMPFAHGGENRKKQWFSTKKKETFNVECPSDEIRGSRDLQSEICIDPQIVGYYGNITDVVMYDNGTQRPQGFGFITYDSEDVVEVVVQKIFHELHDKLVEVKRAVPKEGNTGSRGKGFGGYGSNHGGGNYGRMDNNRYGNATLGAGRGYAGYGPTGYATPAPPQGSFAVGAQRIINSDLTWRRRIHTVLEQNLEELKLCRVSLGLVMI